MFKMFKTILSNASLASLILMMLFPVSVRSEISSQKETQLRAIFSWPASFTEERVTLKPAQVLAVQSWMNGQLNAKHKSLSIFTATAAGRLQGYIAFFEVQEPDGSRCPAAAGVRPDGTIAKAVVFSRLKDNPLAQEDFLAKFSGLKVGDSHAWVHKVKGKMLPGSIEAMQAMREVTSIIVDLKGLDKGD